MPLENRELSRGTPWDGKDELLNPPTTSELLSEEKPDLASKGLIWGLAGGTFVGLLKSVGWGFEYDLSVFVIALPIFSTAGGVAGGLIGGGTGLIAQKIDSFLRFRS